MNSLRDLIDRKTREFQPPPRGWERLQEHATKRRRNRRLGAGLGALVVIAAGVLAALAILPLGSSRPQPASSNSPKPTPAPSPSPIKGTIAFAGFDLADQRLDIYVMDAKSNQPKRITHFYFNVEVGSWSPDGTQLVMERGISEGRGELLILDVRTHRSRVLTKFGGPPRQSRWSPDGSEVAFTTGTGQLHTIRPNGKGLRKLTSSTCWDGSPTWSPDGTQLAFYRDCEGGGKPGIYVMNADGTHITRILPWRSGVISVSWSPDGTKFAIGAGNVAARLAGLYTLAIDGSGLTRLTSEPVGHPAWSPESDRILFLGGNDQIWAIPSNGGRAVQVTHIKGLQFGYWSWFRGT
jgi:Tol biopolymer transport system component